MRTVLILKLSILFIPLSVIVVQPVRAGIFAGPLPLASIASKADLVIVGKLVQSNLIPGPYPQSGNYTYEVARTLKGQSTDTITVILSSLMNAFYGNHVTIEGTKYAILLLKRTGTANYVPVDPVTPLLPLSDEVWAKLQSYTGSTMPVVVSMLLDSCDDPSSRKQSAAMLVSVVDPRIVGRLSPYMDDPDLETRDRILCCLEINQDIAAIPDVADASETYWRTNNGVATGSCLVQLRFYKSSAAEPYIAALIFKQSPFLRLNASMALHGVMRERSLPFLIVGMEDPDASLSCGFYSEIHVIAPVLGPADSLDYFQSHKAREKSDVYKFWALELQQPSSISPSLKNDRADVPTLNRIVDELSAHDPKDRLAGIEHTEKLTGDDKVGCLLLALVDPEPRNAYSAYLRLSAIIPGCNKQISMSSFTANKAKAEKPIYQWWRDELYGKHLPPCPYRPYP